MFGTSFSIGPQKFYIINMVIKRYWIFFCLVFKDRQYRSPFQQLTLYYLFYYLSLNALLLFFSLFCHKEQIGNSTWQLYLCHKNVAAMRQNIKQIKILLMITGHYFGNFIWTIIAGLEMVKATVFKLTSLRLQRTLDI